MLIGHLAPGYFAAVQSRGQWRPEWGRKQQALLWVTALGSSFLSDYDVLINVIFRGFINHSVLWTHSLFLPIGFGMAWLVLHRIGSWFYVQILLGLAAIGLLSHIILDALTHTTPALYPVSMVMIGFVPSRVAERGFWGYVTEPVILADLLLVLIATVHWVLHTKLSNRLKASAITLLVGSSLLFSAGFLALLPTLQDAVRAL